MAKIPPENPATPSDPFAHGPIESATTRISPADYTPAFLRDLKARNEVMHVDENWSAGGAALPPEVNWVLHPNGDLERIGFN